MPNERVDDVSIISVVQYDDGTSETKMYINKRDSYGNISSMRTKVLSDGPYAVVCLDDVCRMSVNEKKGFTAIAYNARTKSGGMDCSIDEEAKLIQCEEKRSDSIATNLGLDIIGSLTLREVCKLGGW